MEVSAAVVVAFTCALGLGVAGCGGSSAQSSCRPADAAPPKPVAAPHVVLTDEEAEVWAKLPPNRSAVPVLLYHGIGPESAFSNSADAEYGIDAEDFAKQMTMIAHAGYQTIDLATFLAFVQGKPVDLPPRPILLTFDDGRSDSWTGADDILRKLAFNAVLFVDTGRVDRCDPEYLTWDELQTVERSPRWELQLHAGPDGHEFIQYGPDKEETGPYYAYQRAREDFDEWQDRVRSDIDDGQAMLADHIPTFKPLAFALPYGTYGQDGTNDPKIPPDLLGWLTGRFDAVFTQDEDAFAHPGSGQPLGRIQVTRATSGGDLNAMLLAGR